MSPETSLFTWKPITAVGEHARAHLCRQLDGTASRVVGLTIDVTQNCELREAWFRLKSEMRLPRDREMLARLAVN
jgi:hypothetical protein